MIVSRTPQRLFKFNPDRIREYEDEGYFVRGVNNLAHVRNFMSFCSYEKLSSTGLEDLIEFEYDTYKRRDEDFEDFVNRWLANRDYPYTYDHDTGILSSDGVNAGSLSNVIATSGCPTARYFVVFDGRLLGDNIAGDGAVVKPTRIVRVYTNVKKKPKKIITSRARVRR